MGNEYSLVAKLKAQDAGFTSTLSKAGSAMEKMSGKTERSGAKFSDTVKRIALATGIFKVVSAGINMATGQISAAFTRMDTMDNFQRNMTRVTGSAEIAKGVLEELKGATKGTAYGLNAVANATQSFANSAIPLEKSTTYAKDWMDAVSAYGDGTTETYDRVMLQLNQMASKGKANLGDLKSAMEAGVPVLQILAAQTGKTAQQVSDELSAGKLSSEEFMDAMHTAFTSGAGSFKSIENAAKQAGSTWKGSFDNMKSALTRGVVEFINAFDSITKTLTGIDMKGWVANFGSTMENGMKAVGQSISLAMEKLVPFVEVMRGAFFGVGTAIKNAVAAVMTSLKGMSEGFGNTAQIETFSDVMYAVANAIERVAEFVQRNSDAIVEWMGILVKGALAWKAFQITMGIGAGFVRGLENIQKLGLKVVDFGMVVGRMNSSIAPVLQSVGGAFVNFGSTVSSTFTNMRADGFNVITSGLQGFRTAILNTSPSLMQFSQNLTRTKLTMRQMGEGNLFTRPFTSLISTLEMTSPRILRFNTAIRTMGTNIRHPITAINNLGTSLMASTGATTFAGAGFSKLATLVRSSCSAMGRSITQLTMKMLGNPITALLVLLSAAVVAVAVAWKNNFMNMREVVDNVFGSFKQSFTSLGNMFKGLLPSLESLKKAFKSMEPVLKIIVGILGGALVIALGLVIDALRLIVLSVATVIRGFKLLGQAGSAMGKLLTGDIKGAKDEMKSMGDTFKDQADAFEEFGKNSATVNGVKSAYESFGDTAEKTGEKTKESANVVVTSLDTIRDRAQQTASSFQESMQLVEEAFKIEGQNETNLKFIDELKKSSDEYLQNNEKVATAYEKQMQKMNEIDEKNTKGRKTAELKAHNDRLKGIQENNAAIISQEKDLSAMLADNVDRSGEQLNETQRTALKAQLETVRNSKVEENQLYIESAQRRLELGKKVEGDEINQLVQSITQNYTTRKALIAQNEEEIKQQEEIRNNAQSETEKQNAQNKINALNENNNKMREQVNVAGAQMLEILNQQGILNTETVVNGLKQMGDMSDPELIAFVQKFQQLGVDTDTQMLAFVEILRNKGIEGVDQLEAGFKSKDLSGMTDEAKGQVIAGISTLPPELFNGGQQGKDKYIEAIKGGDYKSAGKYMMTDTASGVDIGSTDLAKSANTATEKAKKEAESKKEAFKNVGGDLIGSLDTGIKEKGKDVSNSAKKVADDAKSSAGKVDFKPVGDAIPQGIARGITSNSSFATNALDSLMADLQTRAKASIDSHSPSRWFAKQVGETIPQGIAVGVNREASEVQSSIENMMDRAKSVTANSPLSSLFEKGDTTISVDFQTSLGNKLDDLVNAFSSMAVILEGEPVGRLVAGPVNNEMGYIQHSNGRGVW
ncbi:tape measure protein [Carnobacterium divergens]|uniref:tape measure protein n=1 Tax=Carnobacterium divergens TaxID=2748 RepID=UPI0039C97C1E